MYFIVEGTPLNQSGGGTPEHPIFYPPTTPPSPGIPTHPWIPPQPGVPTHPWIPPTGLFPSHPWIPPQPGAPAHPWFPPQPGSPTHPIFYPEPVIRPAIAETALPPAHPEKPDVTKPGVWVLVALSGGVFKWAWIEETPPPVTPPPPAPPK